MTITIKENDIKNGTKGIHFSGNGNKNLEFSYIPKWDYTFSEMFSDSDFYGLQNGSIKAIKLG